MSVRPLDFQIVLPKANEVGRMNQNEIHRIDQDQQFAMQQLVKDDKKKQQVVIETKKSENNKINVDEERQKEKKNGKKDKKRSDNKDVNNKSTSVLDSVSVLVKENEKEIVSSFDMRI